MENNIFLPSKIKVGFQGRNDTYTKKLAYVIYYDQKNVLRKEKSWESWRDKKIEPEEYDNVPTSGFVLNKKAGGYNTGWNHRQTYCRVFDPRGFEFEITIPNLLYILENTNSIKGKGLEGEFVYGWSGTDLILVPAESPDYVELTQFNKLLHSKEFIKPKDFIPGVTYKTINNVDLVYLGAFNKYGNSYDYRPSSNEGKHFWFCTKDNNRWSYFEIMKTINRKFIQVVDSECDPDYSTMLDRLEHNENYSPWDRSKNIYFPYEFDVFSKLIGGYSGTGFYTQHYRDNNTWSFIRLSSCYNRGTDTDRTVKYYVRQVEGQYVNDYSNRDYCSERGTTYTAEQLFEKFKPCRADKYLENGKPYEINGISFYNSLFVDKVEE